MTDDRASGLIERHRADLLHGGPAFTVEHRAFRVGWSATWLLLAAWTPPPLHPWRAFLLRLFGARIGPGVHVYPSARVWYPPNLEMGEGASLGRGANCYCMGLISIGAHAVVSQGAHLCAGTHDPDDPGFPLTPRPIGIGAYAWIAAEAFVGPGVTVGEGAVLGARGVTTKDLAPWTIYAGNPATRLRERRHAA
jgi:putative colanic acid biosynthesis acetyltransferase WcaF